MEPYLSMLKDKEKLKALSRVTSHLMGDGNVSKRYLRYSNKNRLLLNNFEEDFEFLFPDTHFIKGKVSSGTLFIQVQNKQILTFINSLAEGFYSHCLKIPKFVNSFELKQEFLKAIYDDEGCVALRIFKKTGEIKRNLEIGSKSNEFLGEIKIVLEKDFNILCNKIISFKRNLNGKEFVTWKLSITGKENFEKFRNFIGFTHPDKIQKLNEMINSYIRK